MINEKEFAFGLDTERYSSSPEAGKWMDWQVVALHQEPTVRFVAVRAGISWGYQDSVFAYNWKGVRDMDLFRLEAGIETYPVGRLAYHVIYPGENPITQVDNFFRIVGDASWDHDRLVIDLELHHNQTRRTITDCTKQFAYKCFERTGRYPLLYTRSLWLNQYTYPGELSFMDLWLAQYRRATVGYTPEYEPPPNPLPNGFSTWLVHQTADRGKPIGSPVKKVMDYNRWNGGIEKVIKYFGWESYETPEPEPTTPEQPELSLEARLKALEARVTTIEEQLN